ncbi:MAG: DUF2384 domain-containing protein [Acetobacteraceae bacterium]|nr:DUF2384 domain-containing protein [Acetobacteraceae bacterium]
MLGDYDAQAVAEVLGIGFLRTSGGMVPPGAASVTGTRRSGARTSHQVADVVIRVDDESLAVVEAGADGPGHPLRRRPGRTGPAPQAALSPPSAALIEKAVEQGLPRTALRHVAECLAGGDRTKVARLEWGVVPKTTLERREKQLSPEESERTERVARLFVHARRALGTEAEAREFMTAPHPMLDGRSPLDAARTDLGTRRTERILNALEYGLAL